MKDTSYDDPELHPRWPSHLTRDEFEAIIADSRTLFEVSQKARMNRADARAIINRMYGDYSEVLRTI